MDRKFYVWIGAFRNNLCENSQMIEFQFGEHEIREQKKKKKKLAWDLSMLLFQQLSVFAFFSFHSGCIDGYKTSIIYDIDRKVWILTSNVLENM